MFKRPRPFCLVHTWKMLTTCQASRCHGTLPVIEEKYIKNNFPKGVHYFKHLIGQSLLAGCLNSLIHATHASRGQLYSHMWNTLSLGGHTYIFGQSGKRKHLFQGTSSSRKYCLIPQSKFVTHYTSIKVVKPLDPFTYVEEHLHLRRVHHFEKAIIHMWGLQRANYWIKKIKPWSNSYLLRHALHPLGLDGSNQLNCYYC